MISLIISVYNNKTALEQILTALTIQSYKDFEVFIADDGSGNDIKEFISDFTSHSPYKINHIFHDDKGFRKNKILNESINKSKTDYIVFIDGDCIPHSEFMYQHNHNKQVNTVLCGRRVNLSEKMSSEITTSKILSKEYEKRKLKHIYDSWRFDKKSRSTWVEEGFLIKNEFIRNLYIKGEPRIVGCNFSLHKETIEKINGFDEYYEGPGIGEDSDIEFRLRIAGVKFKTIRNLAILFHLYHPLATRPERNYEYFREVQKKKEFVCKNGLRKLS